MKYIITVAIVLTSFLSFSQGYPPVEDANQSLEDMASAITDQYDRELSMTGKQKAIFKLRVEDFLLLRKKILDSKTDEAQLDALVNLQAEETLAMNDVLTRIQMDVYKKVKPEIQPLKIVK